MKPFITPISEFIWNIKYRYRLPEGIIDQTIEDTWDRVAQKIASAEPAALQRKKWHQKFLDILNDFQFLPGGRILATAGTKHNMTLFNCFVMGHIEDSLSGIFKALEEGALTLQQGGGIGFDFSTLRPKGQLATHSSNIASGPVSFMRIWDSMSATIQSTGARRGAMMGTLRCDHPDIEQFIDAKSDPTQLRHFNVSILISDDFLKAVRENAKWPLVFPSDTPITNAEGHKDTVTRHWPGFERPVPCHIYRYVRARDLWERIIKAAYDYAEPGVLFIDTINRNNPLWYREYIHATNPCGEIPLPPYGACDLGAINLTKFVINPFQQNATIDWDHLETVAATATRFLDNVITVSRYPLRAQRKAAHETRRIGLGFTGLADALVMLGLRYDSNPAIQTTKKMMQCISQTAWHTSIALAQEKGKFPAFKMKSYLQGEFVQALPEDIKREIKKHGVRNSHHTTIAPTGSISLLANNISNGIEPIFQTNYKRRVLSLDGTVTTFDVQNYAHCQWQKINLEQALPPGWVDAQSLTPEDHLQMQAAIQPFIDNAISKTIYIPEDFPFKKLRDLYTRAYELHLKGCTIFRPNPVTGSVISTQDVEQSHCCVLNPSMKKTEK